MAVDGCDCGGVYCFRGSVEGLVGLLVVWCGVECCMREVEELFWVCRCGGGEEKRV